MGSQATSKILHPFAVAVTGGIASGKTTITSLFATLGVPIIDADILAREVVASGTAGLRAVTEAFGTQITRPDGTLDRRKLRDLVFQDSALRTHLETILHPLIRQAAIDAAASLQHHPYILHCVPLLVETQQWRDHWRVLVVDVSEQTQVQRLQQRDRIAQEDVHAILAAQTSRDARLAIADDIIRNNGPIEALQTQVRSLHEKYLRLSQESQ